MALAIRAAVYARVSTLDQEPENQLQELRRYVEARGPIKRSKCTCCPICAVLCP